MLSKTQGKVSPTFIWMCNYNYFILGQFSRLADESCVKLCKFVDFLPLFIGRVLLSATWALKVLIDMITPLLYQLISVFFLIQKLV
jgi:hypothetical protein